MVNKIKNIAFFILFAICGGCSSIIGGDGQQITINATPLQRISGAAYVIDGDTIVIHQERVRFQGIDAPEMKQTCNNHVREWACGRAARNQLIRLVAGRQVTCVSPERDKYGRAIAECTAAGDRDTLNRQMVATGWAFAYVHYSTEYAADEASARAEKRGFWDSEIMPPWDFRHQQPANP